MPEQNQICMYDICREDMKEIKDSIKRLEDKFEQLFMNGPITLMNSRLVQMESQIKTVQAVGRYVVAPLLVGYGLFILSRMFGG